MKTRTLRTLAAVTLTLTLSVLASSAFAQGSPLDPPLEPTPQGEGLLEWMAQAGVSMQALPAQVQLRLLAAAGALAGTLPQFWGPSPAVVLQPRVLAAQASRQITRGTSQPHVLAAQMSRRPAPIVARPRLLAAYLSRQGAGAR